MKRQTTFWITECDQKTIDHIKKRWGLKKLCDMIRMGLRILAYGDVRVITDEDLSSIEHRK